MVHPPSTYLLVLTDNNSCDFSQNFSIMGTTGVDFTFVNHTTGNNGKISTYSRVNRIYIRMVNQDGIDLTNNGQGTNEIYTCQVITP